MFPNDDDLISNLFQGHDELLEDVRNDFTARLGEAEQPQSEFLLPDTNPTLQPLMTNAKERWRRIRPQVVLALSHLQSSVCGDEAVSILKRFNFRCMEALENPKACPKCGSTNSYQRASGGPNGDLRICKSCGTSWDTKPRPRNESPDKPGLNPRARGTTSGLFSEGSSRMNNGRERPSRTTVEQSTLMNLLSQSDSYLSEDSDADDVDINTLEGSARAWEEARRSLQHSSPRWRSLTWRDNPHIKKEDRADVPRDEDHSSTSALQDLHRQGLHTEPDERCPACRYHSGLPHSDTSRETRRVRDHHEEEAGFPDVTETHRGAYFNQDQDEEEKPGTVCGDCGRTVTHKEYSSGESTCCKSGVVPEEEYGQSEWQRANPDLHARIGHEPGKKTEGRDPSCWGCGNDWKARWSANDLATTKRSSKFSGSRICPDCVNDPASGFKETDFATTPTRRMSQGPKGGDTQIPVHMLAPTHSSCYNCGWSGQKSDATHCPNCKYGKLRTVDHTGEEVAESVVWGGRTGNRFDSKPLATGGAKVLYANRVHFYAGPKENAPGYHRLHTSDGRTVEAHEDDIKLGTSEDCGKPKRHKDGRKYDNKDVAEDLIDQFQETGHVVVQEGFGDAADLEKLYGNDSRLQLQHMVAKHGFKYDKDFESESEGGGPEWSVFDHAKGSSIQYNHNSNEWSHFDNHPGGQKDPKLHREGVGLRGLKTHLQWWDREHRNESVNELHHDPLVQALGDEDDEGNAGKDLNRHLFITSRGWKYDQIVDGDTIYRHPSHGTLHVGEKSWTHRAPGAPEGHATKTAGNSELLSYVKKLSDQNNASEDVNFTQSELDAWRKRFKQESVAPGYIIPTGGNNSGRPDGHHAPDSPTRAAEALQDLHRRLGSALPELHALAVSTITDERAALGMLFNELHTAHCDMGNALSYVNQIPDPDMNEIVQHYSRVVSDMIAALNPYMTKNPAVAMGPYHLGGTLHDNVQEGEDALRPDEVLSHHRWLYDQNRSSEHSDFYVHPNHPDDTIKVHKSLSFTARTMPGRWVHHDLAGKVLGSGVGGDSLHQHLSSRYHDESREVQTNLLETTKAYRFAQSRLGQFNDVSEMLVKYREFVDRAEDVTGKLDIPRLQEACSKLVDDQSWYQPQRAGAGDSDWSYGKGRPRAAGQNVKINVPGHPMHGMSGRIIRQQSNQFAVEVPHRPGKVEFFGSDQLENE